MTANTPTLDLAPSYRALTSAAGAFELHRDFVSVRGPQAREYLQGQLSQDIDALGVGLSALSLLLEPQGRISAFLRITRMEEDAFVLDTDAGFGPAVITRLNRFKLRTKADIETLDAWRCLAVRGPEAERAVISGLTDVAGTELRAAFTWPGLEGIDLIGPDPRAPDDVPRCSPGAYDALRIEAGLPAMGRELEEKTIPEEAGVVAAAVSFTKGCYTGQELVARIDSRGANVPRRLRGVIALDESASAPIRVGATLHIGDSEAGTVTSSAVSPALGPVALAYVKRAHAVPARATVDGAEPIGVEVLELPLRGTA